MTTTSQYVQKSATNTQKEQLVNANFLRPVYAKGWKNYEVAKARAAEYYPDYDMRQ